MSVTWPTGVQLVFFFFFFFFFLLLLFFALGFSKLFSAQGSPSSYLIC